VNSTLENTLSEAEKEGLYALAFDAYTCGNYPEAIKLFKYLVTTASLTAKYWKGLASSLQQNGLLQEAVNCWGMVVLLDENDPTPHFHTAQCLIGLNNTEDARKAIVLAEEMASFDKDLQRNLEQLRALL
jgi:type III secretion system low calcium response chaperone LcrH/SycD